MYFAEKNETVVKIKLARLKDHVSDYMDLQVLIDKLLEAQKRGATHTRIEKAYYGQDQWIYYLHLDRVVSVEEQKERRIKQLKKELKGLEGEI